MKKTGEGGRKNSKQGLHVQVGWSGNIFTSRSYWSGGREEKKEKKAVRHGAVLRDNTPKKVSTTPVRGVSLD